MPTWTNKYAHLETPASPGSYWAKRKTKYGWKLVKADRCPNKPFKHSVVQAIGPQTEKRRKLLERRANGNS